MPQGWLIQATGLQNVGLCGINCLIVVEFAFNHVRDQGALPSREWTIISGARLVPIGAMGPLPGTDVAMQLDWAAGGAAHWFHQSAAFVIAQLDPPRMGI
jgi:hypothetical protein